MTGMYCSATQGNLHRVTYTGLIIAFCYFSSLPAIAQLVAFQARVTSLNALNECRAYSAKIKLGNLNYTFEVILYVLCIYIRVHTYTHTYTYTYTHTYIHTYMQTYIHTCKYCKSVIIVIFIIFYWYNLEPACTPGHYSSNKVAPCQQCATNYYQVNIHVVMNVV